MNLKETLLLEIKNLSKRFEIKEHFYSKTTIFEVFKDINFKLDLGDKLNLKGANGCGKTTLVKIIAMLDDFNDGDIIFNQKSLKNLTYNEKREIRKDLILIMQNQKSALNPFKNIKWHFDMVCKNYNVRFNDELFYDFFSDDKILYQYPSELSGGEAQIIGLLRAFFVKPKLLILDEVEAGLDKNAIKKFIKHCQAYENSMILISHVKEIAEGICNRNYEIIKKV